MDLNNYISSFLIGGAFCLIAQVLIDKTKLTPARILVGYVVAGVILSAIGIYDSLVDIGKAGATVPLTGFGHNLAVGVREAVQRDGLLGALTGGISACAGGITAALVFGFTTSLVFRSRMK